jgi:putative membrane protein
MVGSLTTTAPENFTNVRSEQANIAGDGKGGTKLSFTMTLFPPIGSDTAEFGYTADIVDGVVPRSDVSALPVNPLESPTFASAADSYQGGTDTGAKLAEGAATIDSNLLKLRDGASELLAGLIKLHEGSARLQAGLADDAAPGAAKLADGTGQAADGADRLADGAGRLDDGLGQLDGGVGDLSSGADRLAAGQRDLAGGLKLLYQGVDELPPTVKAELGQNPDYLKLLGALQGMADAVDERFLPGLQGIETSLRTQFGNIDAIADGLIAGASVDSLASAKQALVSLSAINGCSEQGSPPPVYSAEQPPPSTECGLISGVYHGLVAGQAGTAKKITDTAGLLKQITTGLRLGLFDNDDAAFKRLKAGLSTGADPRDCGTAPQGTCGVKEGALFIRNYGIPTLVDKLLLNIEQNLLANIGRPTPGCDTSETLRCGAAALAAGGGDLTAGVDKLVAGVNKLANGGSLLSSGAGDLSDGLGQIDDGANKLADGLGDAADGSGRLTDGLGQASDGAPKLVAGAQKLSNKGTSKLVEAGRDTTQTYGQMYATMQAGAERAQVEDMAYGAPEGAAGLTAYSYVIQGEDGEAGRNWARGLAGMALLGLGGGGFLLRRRLV